MSFPFLSFSNKGCLPRAPFVSLQQLVPVLFGQIRFAVHGPAITKKRLKKGNKMSQRASPQNHSRSFALASNVEKTVFEVELNTAKLTHRKTRMRRRRIIEPKHSTSACVSMSWSLVQPAKDTPAFIIRVAASNKTKAEKKRENHRKKRSSAINDSRAPPPQRQETALPLAP